MLGQSLYLSLPDHQLHLKYFSQKSDFPPIVCIHGAIENGKIFYSNSGKGLAPYLARNGFSVYVLDLRGKGKSTPFISKQSQHGQWEVIVEDLPAVIEFIAKRHPSYKQQWIAHSWGGVLLYSTLARFPHYIKNIGACVMFGSKRNINVMHAQKFLTMNVFWNRICRALVKVYGYLPAKNLKFGSDNESDLFHKHVVKWASAGEAWIDPIDHFNYQEAILKCQLPPTYQIAAQADRYLGHPKDVWDFMVESGAKAQSQYQILSKKNGNQFDYDHINMLTHPLAEKDHFPSVLEFLRRNYLLNTIS